MQPAWLEVRVDVPASAAEPMANYLLELGSPGLVTEDTDGRSCLIAYFADAAPLDAIHAYADQLSLAQRYHISVRQIVTEDWAENWKQHFPPLAVGRRFFVCPPWTEARPSDRTVIVIDPGMAFGTGHHATTRGCLQLLERHLPDPCPCALDVGTGSGILAIGLAMLGVPRVVAVDTDSDASAAATANAARNGVAHVVSVVASLDGLERGAFPLVLANIQLGTLLDLQTRMTELASDDATLIASGLLQTDVSPFVSAYTSDWQQVDRLDDGEWISLVFRRRP